MKSRKMTRLMIIIEITMATMMMTMRVVAVVVVEVAMMTTQFNTDGILTTLDSHNNYKCITLT